MEYKKGVLSAEELQQMLGIKGWRGRFVSRLAVKLLEIDKANATQAKFANEGVLDFVPHALEDVGIKYEVPPEQLERIPKEGGFITVSNHHYGSVDGLILCDTVYRRRQDYKLLTNFLLALIPNLKEVFLPVNNMSSNANARSVNGIRAALNHISSGGALGIFPVPEGQVATWQDSFKVEDKPWAPNMIRFIQKASLPVIPIYFHGGNSLSFHLLGKIHRRLRTARLIHELFNKKGKTVQVRIGEPISVEEMKGMDVASLGKFLRDKTYALAETCK